MFRLAEIAQAIVRYRRAWRMPLLVLGLGIFALGSILSFRSISIDTLVIGPFLILILLLAPLGLLNAAMSFKIMSHGAGLKISFWDSFRISCIAQAAEVLPIPGGALVRGGAMMNRGASSIDAAAHVTVSALLWIGCAAGAAGLSVGLTNWAGILLVAGGTVTVGLSLLWLALKASLAVSAAALASRVAGLAITGLRMTTAFASIGLVISLAEGFPFAFATIAGTASSIAPGGFGVSEALAAALATMITVAPGAAFLAVALNRIVSVLVSGILSSLFLLEV